VDDHTCGVDRSPKPGASGGGQLQLHASDQVARIGSGLDLFTRASKGGSRRRDEQRPRRRARQALVSRQLVD
jgi:hypothetical protein